MKNSCLSSVLILAALTLAVPRSGRADSLLIGNIAFDSGTSPGQNSFDLFNFTGGFIDPDGIIDTELFSGTLNVTTSAGTSAYTFSNVDTDGTTIVSFASNVDVLGATLSLALSNSQGVNIYDASGNPAVADLQPVPVSTLPLVAGSSTLTPCDGTGSPCSNIHISVDTAPSVVPEPTTMWLVLSGMSSAAAFRRGPRRR